MYPSRSYQLQPRSDTITYRGDFTLPTELLEQIAANGFDKLPELIRVVVNAGSLAWGYFGGLADAATGLIYMGDEQYYDPSTGRFLTRQPVRLNPYVPWGGDPAGALLGPLTLLVLLHKRLMYLGGL